MSNFKKGLDKFVHYFDAIPVLHIVVHKIRNVQPH